MICLSDSQSEAEVLLSFCLTELHFSIFCQLMHVFFAFCGTECSINISMPQHIQQ